jgi:oligo-1,6-glucosidase
MLTKYKNSTVYQIYPRSFCDSDGDGIGDIKGIISKLDYIASLGVDVIWLSPVYKSPNDDNGYDISDYKDIQPEFGTMADFDTLLSEAKARGISIIMDLVINHTSDEHEWFERAKAGEQKYKDYYIIKKGKNGKLPNNWGNFFAECPWEPFGDPKNEEYYLHLFSKKQPDLNWYNPEVYQEVCDIMRFWLDKGVAGFRCDVINVIFKQSFKDGKKSLALTGKEHYLSTDGCHNILAALRRDVLSHYDTLTVGETVMVDLKEARDLTLPERGELDMVFAFEHMECDQVGIKWFKTKFKPKKLMNVLTK